MTGRSDGSQREVLCHTLQHLETAIPLIERGMGLHTQPHPYFVPGMAKSNISLLH